MDESQLGGSPVPEKRTEQISDVEILKSVKEHGANFFPGFPIVDSSEFDSYKPEEDLSPLDKSPNDRGRVLYLTTEAGRGDGKPEIRIIFRPDGFTFGFLNSPEPDNPYTYRSVGDSIYGPAGRKWKEDEIDLAMMYGKIRMEGADTNSDEFRNQLVGWSEDEGRFTTMQEEMDRYVAYSTEAKKNKVKLKVAEANYPTGINLARIKELVLARLTFNQPSSLSEAIMEKFATDEDFVRNMMRREITAINAYRSLVADKRMLPPRAYGEIDHLKV